MKIHCFWIQLQNVEEAKTCVCYFKWNENTMRQRHRANDFNEQNYSISFEAHRSVNAKQEVAYLTNHFLFQRLLSQATQVRCRFVFVNTADVSRVTALFSSSSSFQNGNRHLFYLFSSVNSFSFSLSSPLHAVANSNLCVRTIDTRIRTK